MNIQSQVDDARFEIDVTDIKIKTALEGHVEKAWKQGTEQRKTFKAAWDEAESAYNQETASSRAKKSNTNTRMDKWRTDIALPWSRKAVDAFSAFQSSVLMPVNEKMFDIIAKDKEEKVFVEALEKAIEQDYKDFGSMDKLEASLVQIGIKGVMPLKQYWHTEIRTDYSQGQAMNRVVKNGVCWDYVDIEDFVIYPIFGKIEESIKVHRCWMTRLQIDEVAKDYGYFNLEGLPKDGVKSSTETVMNSTQKPAREGLEVLEAYVPRIELDLNGKRQAIKNVVITTADGKLIGFKKNEYPQGESPYHFTALYPTGKHLLSAGIIQPGVDLEKLATTKLNTTTDALKITVYPMLKYREGSQAFDPVAFIAQPGGLIPVDEIDDLQPLSYDLSGIQLDQNEFQNIKAEFEEATVSRVVKGEIESGNKTATETMLTEQNASSQLGRVAMRISRNILQPMIAQAVEMYCSMIKAVPEAFLTDLTLYSGRTPETEGNVAFLAAKKVAELSGVKMEQQPAFLMQFKQILARQEKFEVNVVGYMNHVQRLQAVKSMTDVVTVLQTTPAAPYIDWYGLGREMCERLGVEPDSVFVDEEAKAQIDEASNQQAQAQSASEQAMLQQQQQVLELEAMKIQSQKDKTELDARVKILETMIKYQIPEPDELPATDLTPVEGIAA